MRKEKPIITPSEYYDSIIFQERDKKKIYANDFINELIDMALNFYVNQNIAIKEDELIE